MENTSLLRLKNVHYYSDRWAGDLVITQNVIYYFPLRDLEKEREKNTRLPGLIGIIMAAIINSVKTSIRENRAKKKSYFDSTNLWNLESNEEKLCHNLDKHISELKQQEIKFKEDNIFTSYSSTKSSRDLPYPMRFEKNKIKNFAFTSDGIFFETVADKHNFTIRWSDKNIEALNSVLQKADFIPVKTGQK